MFYQKTAKICDIKKMKTIPWPIFQVNYPSSVKNY